MTVDRKEAGALLNDIAGIENRVRELLIYARVSDYLFIWGVIWIVGSVASQFLGVGHVRNMWLVLDAIGLLATAGTAGYRVHQRSGAGPTGFVIARAAISVFAFTAFGTLWIHLTDMGWREQVTFWPSFMGFMLFTIGLWSGRSIAIAGAVIFALALLGYAFAGDYINLWMAAAGGGTMIAIGVWLRR